MDDITYWVEDTNLKLKSISNDLADLLFFLESSNIEETGPAVLPLLEFMNQIQADYRSVVENIKSCKDNTAEAKTDLQTQFESLEKSMELLKMESNK